MFRTETLDGAGKTPSWNEATQFKVADSSEQLSIQVWDADMAADDLICEGTITLADLMHVDGEQETVVSLTYEGQPSGTIRLVSSLL